MTDALIERLRAFAALPLSPENIDDQNMCREAADALAELRGDVAELGLREAAMSSEIAKLRDEIDTWKGLADHNKEAAEEVEAQLHDYVLLAQKHNAEIAKLQARLEIDHYFVGSDMRRVEVPPDERDSQIDGIEARDCTIKMQDEQLVKQQFQIGKQQGQIGELWLENSRLMEALEEIARGQGAYSPDKFEHCRNTVTNLKSIARAALIEKP